MAVEMAPADFDLAREQGDEAVRAAQDAGVDQETISALTRGQHESTQAAPADTQEATEVTQDVPVGSEFSTDFASMGEEQEVEESPISFMQTTEITNPYVKQVLGEAVNDPVIYQNKLNRVAAYEMQLNGADAKTARTRAAAALDQSDLNTVLQGYKSQVAQQMEIDWKEYIQTASPEEILSYHEFKKQHNLAEAYEGKIGDQTLFTDTHGSLTLDEEREANVQIQGYARSLFADRVDELDAFDWAASGAGLFIPDYIKDVNDLTDVGLFDTKETYFNFIEAFKAATPGQKKTMIDLYIPKVWDAFEGNPLKAVGALDVLFDESHEASFWLDATFDVADLGFWGFDAVKLGIAGYAGAKMLKGARSSKKLNSLTNIKSEFRDVDNVNAAAETTAASKADEAGDIQTGNNQNQYDEATDVNGINTENNLMTDNSVDGLADAHTRLFEQITKNKTSAPFQQNFLSKIGRTRLAGLSRGVNALVKRHRSNITKLKGQLAKEPKPRFRKVTPDESADLLNQGYRVYDRTEDSVTMVKGTDRSLRLQRELVRETGKLERASAQLTDIDNQLRYGEIVADQADDAMAMNRGEVPRGSEDVVQAEEEALGNLYRGLTKNAAEAVQAGLTRNTAQQIVNNIRDNMEHLKGSLDEILPEMLTAAEKTAIEKAAIEKIQNAAADAGKVIRSVDILEQDRKGFKIKITYENGSSVEQVRFTESDIGDFGIDRGDITANLVQSFGSKIFSPEHQMDAADRTGRFGGLVRDSTFAGDQAARIKRALNKMARNITKPLSRKNRDQLDRLILASDEASTETERLFTVKELSLGVETAKGNEIITPEVMDAYFKMHLFLGETKRLMDWSVRRSLEVKGFKNLSYKDKGKLRQSIVKPVKNWGAVDFTQKQKVLMYDEASETWGSVDAATLVNNQDRLKDEGYQLVEFFSKETDSAGTVTSHGLVPSDPRVSQVGDLPQSVLNTTKGMYVPRVYKAGYYYVRDAGDARKNTVLAFERKVDAERYVEKKAQEGKNYSVRQDGDMGYEDSLIALAQGYGGLYTSARKRENLQMVAAGKDPETDLARPERLGGMSSVQRYLDATSNMMPMGEQRIAAVRRFENQLDRVAKQFGFNRGLETPGDFNSKILLPEGSPEKALFETMRNHIRGSYGSMDSGERAFQGLMTSVAQFMEKGSDYPIIGPISENARKFAVNLASMDVRGKLLGATFDAHLGWFNPSQLYVQMQNAALAVSMHPIDGAKAIPQAFAARTMIFTSNEPEIAEIAGIVSKGMGFRTDEFIDTVRAFRKSGMYDSVMRVADYGGKAAGVGGTSLDKFREAARAGRVAYEEGELMSRITSFFIAKENLKRKMGKGFNLKDPEMVKQLSDETYRIMMNMQKDNAAWWQNNWWGIPLQFAQVQAKLIENILPTALGGSSRWTAKEKMNVLGGQVLLYGAVGVPLVESTTNYMINVLGVEPTELKEESPQVLEFIQEGMTGVLSQALGFQNNFSDRGSIIKGLDDNALGKLVSGVYRTMKYKDDEVQLSDFLGAALNTYYRGGEAVGQLVDSIDTIFYKPTGDVVLSEVGNVSDAFMAITSTWSNAQKAHYLHNTGLHSGNGNLMVPASEFSGRNYVSTVARVMGFPYDKESAFYNTFEAQRAYQRDWTYLRQGLKQRMMEQMQNPGDIEVYQRDINHLLMPLTETERDRMMEQIIQETVSGENALDKQMKETLRMHLSGALQQSQIQGIE